MSYALLMMIRVLIMMSLLWFARTAIAASREEQILTWLEQTLAESGKPPEQALEVAYTFSSKSVVDQGRIEELRRLVAGRPEHPERGLLSSLERTALTNPPPAGVEHRVWYAGPLLWRQNRDYQADQTGRHTFLDNGFSEEFGWRGSDSLAMHIMKPGVPIRPGLDVAHAGSTMVGEIRVILFGAASGLSAYKIDPASLRVEGEQWTVMLHSEHWPSVELNGRWNAQETRGFADRSVVQQPKRPWRDIAVLEWEHDAGSDLWFASRIEERLYIDGQDIIKNCEVTQFGPTSIKEVRRVVEPPWFDRPDAVRGMIEWKAIHDYRSGELRELSRDSSGRLNELVHDSAAPGTSPRQVSRRSWLFGGIAGGALILGLAALRWLRR